MRVIMYVRSGNMRYITVINPWKDRITKDSFPQLKGVGFIEYSEVEYLLSDLKFKYWEKLIRSHAVIINCTNKKCDLQGIIEKLDSYDIRYVGISNRGCDYPVRYNEKLGINIFSGKLLSSSGENVMNIIDELSKVKSSRMIRRDVLKSSINLLNINSIKSLHTVVCPFCKSVFKVNGIKSGDLCPNCKEVNLI